MIMPGGPGLEHIQSLLADGLERVGDAFAQELSSDLPPLRSLVEHVERYRGKMLRPTLVLLSGLAARTGDDARPLSDAHITIAAVCEMVHMATLVHDDVLDDAEVRRGGLTVNRLRGNEAAVIMGDFLIASAYRLCSSIEPAEAAKHAALSIGHTAQELCSGELLQLHHREDWSLDRATYFEILERKTASLIGLSCRLGAFLSDARFDRSDALERYGRRIGVAFQIQDDILDLTGSEAGVGKSVGRDLAKGKPTLPLIVHLERVGPDERAGALRLLERASREGGAGASGAAEELGARLVASGAVDGARDEAERLVADGLSALEPLEPGPVRSALELMASAVVARTK